jgi:predicted RNA methylase
MRNHLDGENINNLVFYENGAGKLQVSLIASLLGFKAVVAVEIDTTMSKAVINRFCEIDLHRVVLLNEDSCNTGPCKGCIKFLFSIQTITLYLPPFRSH